MTARKPTARTAKPRLRARVKTAAAREPVAAAPAPAEDSADAGVFEESEFYPDGGFEEPAPPARRAGRESDRVQRMPQRAESVREDSRSAPPANRMYRNRRRTEDTFAIDKSIIPPGSSYEWKSIAVKGKPSDSHQINLRENGWRPVPAKRHPQLVPDGYKGSAIIKDEMMLMERPAYLTEEARQEDYDIAREQVMIKEASIRETPGPNQFTRDHPSVRANTYVRKTHEPMPIAD